ncbi:MAG: hypothetical protein RLZZ127_2546 [Planctomycetota bacterium]|jgi:Fur family ferric uptake transcriptional regulator
MERRTRQREAIRQALVRAARPLAPQELLTEAQGDVPGLGIATVYRTVKALVEDGEAHAVELPGGLTCYERRHQHHHHHFQCRACQRVFEVHGCPGHLERLAPTGFTVDGHDLVLYGRCRDCGKSA